MPFLRQVLIFFSLNKRKGIYFFISALNPRILLNYLIFLLCNKICKYHIPWRPFGIVVFLNNKCNMKCAFCGRNNGFLEKFIPESFKDMGPIQLKKIFDRLKEIRHVVFCGIGEPLLNNDLFEMIDLCHKNGKETTLYTNGILLNGSTINKIIDHNVSTLIVSIKGVDEKDFFSNTGLNKENFDLVINNIKALVAKNKETGHPIFIALHYVCSRDKIYNMEKMVEVANDLRVDRLSFLNLILPYPAAAANLKYSFFESDKEVINSFKILSKKAKMQLKLPPLIKKRGFNNSCSVMSGCLMIDGFGNVSPCCRIPPKGKFGNIFKDKDLLNNKTFSFLRRTIRTKPMYQCLICHSLFPA